MMSLLYHVPMIMISDKHVQEAWSLTEGWSSDLQQVGNENINPIMDIITDFSVIIIQSLCSSQVHPFSVSLELSL